MFGKKEPKEEQKPVGGIPFFISIICLVLIAINNICSLPMKLEDGWNQVHINFEDFVKKAFGTNYMETKI